MCHGTFYGTEDTLYLFADDNDEVVRVALRRKVNAGTPEPVTSGLVVVSTPTFTRLENYNSALQATTTTIRFNITMNYNSAAPDYAYSKVISGSAGLR